MLLLAKNRGCAGLHLCQSYTASTTDWLAAAQRLPTRLFTVCPAYIRSGESVSRCSMLFSQSGAGRQSSSVNARYRASACSAPRFLAVAAFECACRRSRNCIVRLNGLTRASSGSLLPSSTTMTSNRARSNTCPDNASRVRASCRLRLYVGTITQMIGGVSAIACGHHHFGFLRPHILFAVEFIPDQCRR